MNMLSVKDKVKPGTKLLKREAACMRYSMSWNTLRRAAEDCQAIVHFGRSVFLNATRLDAYFDALSE